MSTAAGGWPNFQVHPGAFSEPECERIIELGTAAAHEDTEDAGIEGRSDSGGLRRTRVAWIPPGEESLWLYERVERLAREANAAWNLDLEGISEELQFALYDSPGAHYTWHHDGLEHGVEDRKLSVVVQLDDPDAYEGADLEFLEVATDYDDEELAAYRSETRSRGTAITFCSFEYHRVTPLRGGTRRSLVGWVGGPPLR